jgi:flagellin
MSRINTNTSSQLAQRILNTNQTNLTKTMERLSTGLKINRGGDNPAGLIASEKLRAEKINIASAINNAQRADQVVNIAEGGLQEINAMLLEVQSLVGQSANEAGLSDDERQANQLQIDSILQSIDRIASTTSFAGVKLLNGSYDFNVSSQNAKVADYEINAAKMEHGGSTSVSVVVTASAQRGTLFVSAGGSSLNLSSADARFVFEVAGSKGARQFTFASGTTLSSVATSINTFKTVTGVSAVASGNYLKLKSTEFGSDEFVSFKVNEHGGQAGSVFTASTTNENAVKTSSAQALSALTNAVRDSGQDVGLTINGNTATAKGKNAGISSDVLDLKLSLTDAASQTLGSFNALTITGGGAKFNLGPTVDITNQVSIGIKNVAARNLGSASVGFLSDLGSGKANNMVDGNIENAQKIVNKAIDQVSSLRGRLGAFQKNVVGATINSLGVALENTTAAESAIRDTDFATETANLTRSQILVSAATSVLQVANSSPQSVLQLL